MPNLNFLNRQPPAGIKVPTGEILAAPIPRATAILGLSRSTIYRAAAAGRIILRKQGRTTLVDMASAREYLASLPVARIGVGGGE